jgi:septal ring-binding cell division protein DamX
MKLRILALPIALLVLAGCGSQVPAAVVTTPVAVASSTESPTTSTAAASTTPTTSTTTTSSKSAASSTSTSTTTTTTTTSARVVMTPETISGSGDDIVELTSTGLRILKFECPGCEHNVAVKTNGDESLIVNDIGSYSGRHLIDIYDDSKTSELEITATGDWTVTLTDAFDSATTVAGPASGKGDDVVFFINTGTKAQIEYSGEHNFAVQGFGGSRSELAVNEIGDYSGTVRLTMPALVQINAAQDGSWTITPS